MTLVNDLTQIGLSLKAHAQLEQLKNDGYFSEMREAYRFAIALTLSTGQIPREIQSPRTTIFAIPTVDPDGAISIAIRALMNCDDTPPYRWAERLAEVGVEALAAKCASGGLDIASMLSESEADGVRIGDGAT